MNVIRVIDLELTGFDPPASVCDVGWIDLVDAPPQPADEAMDWAFGALHGVLTNPGHPIPPETSAIHHIVDADVADATPWEAAAQFLARCAPPTIYAAHNARSEQKWITTEITGGRPWICTYKCALRLWPEAPAYSNQALRYWRSLKVDPAIANGAHRAGPDAYVTAHLLRDMLMQPGVTVEQLIQWSSEPALLTKCNMGSWRGRRWAEVDEPSFFRWILDRDFDEDLKFTARYYLNKLLLVDQADQEDAA